MAREFLNLGPEAYFKRRGLEMGDLPAVRAEQLGERVNVPVNWLSRNQARFGLDIPPQEQESLGGMYLAGGGLPPERERTVALPMWQDYWTDPTAMQAHLRRLARPTWDVSGNLLPLRHPPITDPDYIAVHELMHAMHHRNLDALGPLVGDIDRAPMPPYVRRQLERHVGTYATTNPVEAVAEIGSYHLLPPPGRPAQLPASIRKAYSDLWSGPDLDRLRRELGLKQARSYN